MCETVHISNPLSGDVVGVIRNFQLKNPKLREIRFIWAEAYIQQDRGKATSPISACSAPSHWSRPSCCVLGLSVWWEGGNRTGKANRSQRFIV